MPRQISTVVLSASLAASLFAVRASAHISLEQGGTQVSRYGDGQDFIKQAPCGVAGGKRGTHIYTYAPGQTIDVSIVEYVPHPSYFRLAFDRDGDDGFKDPASILPIDPTRKCPDGPGDHCGASDFYNTPEVLPNMDDLNPHIPTIADLQSPPKYTWHVTLPNYECDNCTLQVIQVMEDDAFHGPYDPTPGVGIPDVYHQCVDIVLKAGADSGAGGTTGGGEGDASVSPSGGATTAGGATGAGDSTGVGAAAGAATGAGDSTGVGAAAGSTTGGSNGGATNGAAPVSSSSDSGGCSVGSHPSEPNGPSAFALLGFALGGVLLRRRNRRRA